MQEAINDGRAFATEVRMKSLVNNTYRYHLLKVIPVKESNSVLRWVGTFTDINEQKMANEALEAKVALRTLELMNNNRKLENSNHELQQFASVASHDLKEPLRKIQIFSSIIRDRYIKDSAEAVGSINKVIDASARMSGLINDLLDYSRLSVEALFQQLDLNQLLADIQTDMEIAIKDKNALIIIDQLPSIEGIPGQIRQVFQNLISNSLKFSKEGVTPVITIKAEKINDPKDVAEAGQYCRILFADNGIGFDEKYSDRIFTIFQRLHSREAYDGTGIGLAIVKKIIDKHKGQVSAYSKEGEGATFIITLPVHHAGISNNNF
jgi:light-regulated signal transduction histidine kinase (bacteriophytochrome)